MSLTWEDYAKRGRLAKAERDEGRTATLLPDPDRRTRYYTVISVDDHVVEPPHAFDGRLPARFEGRRPAVVDTDDGGQAWLYDGHLLPNVGFNAVAGRPLSEISYEPTRFDDMRRGSWDIKARLHDMDLDGVFASLNFPSFLPGFGGIRMQTITDDLDLALASVRAWNTWCIEEWAGEDPERIIPCQLPWLHDPVLAGREVRQNAGRGFKAMTFPEAPDKAGLPSIHSTQWDPLWAACEETDTVVCVHVGSAGTLPATSPDAPGDVSSILFGGYAMITTVDWLFSRIALRFPRLQIAMSEGGIGWVPSILDRLDHKLAFGGEYFGTFRDAAVTPAELLGRNFSFCYLDDPSTICLYDRIGVDRIMVEVDYPHSDTTWPDSQERLRRALGGLPEDAVAKMTWQNAAALFRHPVPQRVAADPNAF